MLSRMTSYRHASDVRLRHADVSIWRLPCTIWAAVDRYGSGPAVVSFSNAFVLCA